MKSFYSNIHEDSARAHQRNVVLSQPSIVGYMSVDVSRNYHSDLSQLKFVKNISINKVSWDLNHNVDQAVKRTSEDNVEKIDLLLKFLLEEGRRFKFPPNTFILYRRTLINIMYSAIITNNPVCIRASLFNNHIYLHYMVSEQEVLRQKTCTDQEKKFIAWGYKFEQYLSSDEPTLPPDIDKPVVENEEFSLYLCSQIGEHNLFYGAQIDGILSTNDTKAIPKTTDVQEILQYLKSNQYIELKTNKEITHPRHERSLKRYKMLRCWCQCYLANLKGMLVGYRNDDGIVQRLQWFDTADIVEYCKNEWDPQAALNFLNYFLTYVKKYFYSYSCKGYGVHNPFTVDFIIDNENIKVIENLEQHEALLPDWYIEEKGK